MKKVIRLIFCFICIISLSACGKKVELSSSNLSNKLSSLGFGINDITTEIEDTNVKKVYAVNNGKYQIEIYIFKTEEASKKAYKTNKASFIETNKSNTKEKNNDTNDTFYQEVDGRYNQLSRVGKTLVYASVNVEYKKDVKKIIKKIGY